MAEAAAEFHWEWENADTGQWVRYDEQATALIELARTQGLPSASLNFGATPLLP